MKESMIKKYENCGDGMLELCNTVMSISQVMDEEMVCRCEDCMELLGEDEILRREKEKEKRILSMNFQSIIKKLRKIIEEDEERYGDNEYFCGYDNYYNTGTTEDGQPYVSYHTSGGLCFQITELADGGYLYEVVPPGEYFRSGSELYAVLLAAGYILESDNDHNIGETGVSKHPDSDRAYDFTCLTCGAHFGVSFATKDRYCPQCGRYIVDWKYVQSTDGN